MLIDDSRYRYFKVDIESGSGFGARSIGYDPRVKLVKL
jgi:hypothetical protein